MADPPLTQGSGTISDVRAICTAPDGIRLVVVKVETTEPGLYGLGCATFAQRPLAVVTAIEHYLKPFLLGRSPDNIEDIWNAARYSSYWRSGPVLNNALSGVDMALWDIKGKRAGMPLYQLFGGRSRKAADVYLHVTAEDHRGLADAMRRHMKAGFRHFRLELSRSTTTPTERADSAELLGSNRHGIDPRAYCHQVVMMVDYIREEIGDAVELVLDIHEALPPISAIQLAKDLESYGLFFLEDPFAPEDLGYLPMLRAQSSTPIAMGELFVNQQEYVPVVRDRLIDFVRVHISDIGGLTPARKLATLAEFSGIRTAWHGPSDTTPVGLAANLHLDLSCPNFGIQEQMSPTFSTRMHEVFPGCPEIRHGALWSNDRPGLGVDLDEEAAARYPYPKDPLNGGWPEARHPDGSVARP